jgi:hypothetical protein
MAAEDKTIHVTQQLDGTTGNITEITVPTGEIWYVDSIHVRTDGSGDDTGVYNYLGIGSEAAVSSVNFATNLSRSVQTRQFDTSSLTNGSSTLGAFAYGGETIKLDEDLESGTTGQYYITIGIRRVL